MRLWDCFPPLWNDAQKPECAGISQIIGRIFRRFRNSRSSERKRLPRVLLLPQLADYIAERVEFELLAGSGGSRDRTRLRRESPLNGNIRRRGRRLSANSPATSAEQESGDESECAKAGISGPFSRLLGTPAERWNGWLATQC